MGLYKRAFLVFVFLIPVLVAINVLLGETTRNVTKISVSVLVAVIVIAVVELVRNKKMKK
jgi:putative effector of murein hydrolase LrgA (UPF0299 family)